jgi:hypothetical protein
MRGKKLVKTKDHRRTVHHYKRRMMSPEVEPPIPREQLNLEPFTEDERIRLMEVMLDD